ESADWAETTAYAFDKILEAILVLGYFDSLPNEAARLTFLCKHGLTPKSTQATIAKQYDLLVQAVFQGKVSEVEQGLVPKVDSTEGRIVPDAAQGGGLRHGHPQTAGKAKPAASQLCPQHSSGCFKLQMALAAKSGVLAKSEEAQQKGLACQVANTQALRALSTQATQDIKQVAEAACDGRGSDATATEDVTAGLM
ncbi:unnamed protein product, partial [Symbiodinium sp. CCMP2592]